MLADMPRLFGGEDMRRALSEARRAARRPTSIAVTIASTQGSESPVVVRDISTHGCSIEGNADWIKPGAFVDLRPAGEAVVTGAPVTGIVRWTREGAAGIEFVRPLAPGGGGLASLIDDEI